MEDYKTLNLRITSNTVLVVTVGRIISSIEIFKAEAELICLKLSTLITSTPLFKELAIQRGD